MIDRRVYPEIETENFPFLFLVAEVAGTGTGEPRAKGGRPL